MEINQEFCLKSKLNKEEDFVRLLVGGFIFQDEQLTEDTGENEILFPFDKVN